MLERFGISPLYKWVYETVAKDSFVSIEKAQRQLGFAPKLLQPATRCCATSTGTASTATASPRSSGITHRVPWKQGALGVVKRFF